MALEMYIKHFYLKIFLYHLTIKLSESWRPFVFNFRNLSTQSFSKVIDINSSLSNNNISIYANILEQLPNLYSKLVLTFESSNDVYDMEFINRTIDICKLFSNKRYEPVLQIFYKLFSSKNGARSCPIRKKLVAVKNTGLDAENFPPVMPNKKGFFDAYLLVRYGKEMKTISRVIIYFEFKNLNNPK